MLTTGKAATIVRTVRDNNGYEAYRLLRQRSEPENYGKHLTSLTQILKFDFGSNPSEFLDKLIEWEGLIDKYEQETLETISKNLLCAIVVEKAPEAIRMHLLVQCGEKPDWVRLRQTCTTIVTLWSRVQLRWTWAPSLRAGERENVKANTMRTVMARERKVKRANRRRMQRNPRTMISSTVIVGRVDSGDTSRDIVGATRRDHKSIMFLKMNRWHHVQHINRYNFQHSAHLLRGHRCKERLPPFVLRRTEMAGYLEWKATRVQSRIILLVPMSSQTTGGQAREFRWWWTPAAQQLSVVFNISVTLPSKLVKYKSRVVLRGDMVKEDSGAYAVFTEQGSSASQTTAAKIMHVIARLPGSDGQAAAVSAYNQVKKEDASTLLKIRKSECPDFWISLPRQKWPKSWENTEDPVVPLERNLNGHPWAGLLWERQFEEALL